MTVLKVTLTFLDSSETSQTVSACGAPGVGGKSSYDSMCINLDTIAQVQKDVNEIAFVECAWKGMMKTTAIKDKANNSYLRHFPKRRKRQL